MICVLGVRSGCDPGGSYVKDYFVPSLLPVNLEMTTTSHRSCPRRTATSAHDAGPVGLLVRLFVMISLGMPVAASADIYQWTDARGGKVLSNVPPTNNDKARDVKTFVKDTKPAATSAPAAAPAPAAPPAVQDAKKGANSEDDIDNPAPRRRRGRSSR